MKICYVDESGDGGKLPSATSPVQPAFVIAGIIIDHRDLPAITEDFIELKRTLFKRAKRPKYLDGILYEIKGSDIRKNVCRMSSRKRNHSFRFLDGVLIILENYNVKIVGRSWIKGINKPFNGQAIYTYSIQSMFTSLQHYLNAINDIAILIVDSRTHSLNRNVSHSIFTQKFKRAGDDFDRITDLPMFAISDNHAGIQLCDLLCSAFLFPMSVHVYCLGHVNNLHVRNGYRRIRTRYAARLKALQYRFQDNDGRWRGGITVADGIAQRSGGELFR